MLFFEHGEVAKYSLLLLMKGGPPHCEIWYAFRFVADMNLGSQHKEHHHPVPTKRTRRDFIEENKGSASWPTRYKFQKKKKETRLVLEEIPVS